MKLKWNEHESLAKVAALWNKVSHQRYYNKMVGGDTNGTQNSCVIASA